MQRATMTVAAVVLAAMSVFGICAGAEGGVNSDGKAYQEATAHSPNYADQAVWPAYLEVEKAAYSKQVWPKARLLVWSKQGNFQGNLNDAANWLEDGKPAAQPPDTDTDVLFPDVDKLSIIFGSDPLTARHVTVGKGVRFQPFGVGITGNVWVKSGGTYYSRHFRLQGAADTFVRNDGLKPGRNKGFFVRKGDTSSAELLGSWYSADWFQVDSGTLIVGPGAHYGGGNRHQNTVAPKGHMAVLSGATFTTYDVKRHAYDIDLFGSLLIGTPERPLTKDVLFLLNTKPRDNGRTGPNDRSLQTRPESTLAVHSSDPTKARLVIRLYTQGSRGTNKGTELPADDDEDEVSAGAKATAKPAKGGSGKLDFRLLGALKLDGVLFEDVAAGGIQLPDPAVGKTWKLVEFGKGCAPVDTLFAVAGAPGRVSGDDVLSQKDLAPKEGEPEE